MSMSLHRLRLSRFVSHSPSNPYRGPLFRRHFTSSLNRLALTAQNAKYSILNFQTRKATKRSNLLKQPGINLNETRCFSAFTSTNTPNEGVVHRHQIINKPTLNHTKSLHTTRSRNCIITPRDKDPSLEWQRCGKEFLDGPDQVLPSTAISTWHADGACRISKMCSGDTADYPPVSVPTLFKKVTEESPHHKAMSVKRNSIWTNWTYAEYYVDVWKVAKAFIALGLEPHHSVCILGFNSPEWFISDLAAILAGGIPAGIYTTNSPEATAFVAEDSQANIFVVEDDKQLAKVLQKKDCLPHLKAIVQYMGTPGTKGVLSWNELLALGAAQSDVALEKRLKRMAVNQACTIIYTSGTTGNPKGVMISHDNLTWLCKQASVTANFLYQAEEVVSYLPLSHVAAQTADMYIPMISLGTTYFADPDALRGSLIDTLKAIQPTTFLAVPRVWEKMYEKIRETERGTKGFKKTMFEWARKQATIYNEKRFCGHPNPSTLQFRLADALVLSKIRSALGLSRSNISMTAAAPISMEILEYFMSLNIIVCEAYGLSECSGPHTMSVEQRGLVRYGSIGPPVIGTRTKLDKPGPDGQGEICLAGRHILLGYLNREKTTKDAVDSEGWLHTEDVGRIDKDGFVFVTGRIKELLITAGGENIAPVMIEDNIKQALPCLSNAMVIGDHRKFLAVIITLKSEMNPDTNAPLENLLPAAADWLKYYANVDVKTVKEARAEVYEKKNKKVIGAIQAGIDEANSKSVSRAQKINRWYILPADFSMAGGELGPTLKLKRKVVSEKYKKEIDKIYSEGNDPNNENPEVLG